MKNKVRKIVVNNKTYFWSYSRHDGDGDGGARLTVWKNKKNILFSEWLDGVEAFRVTPKLVSEKILNNLIGI